jgi:formylglycine-generating enzyme required for sulfatase activity
MTFEHEAMHLETLLYMLLQRGGCGTVPPSGFTEPSWSSLADTWTMNPKPTSPTVALGPETVTLGHDDIEAEDGDPDKSTRVSDHEFGWDNESPSRQVHVGEFKIEWRPVTNGEYLEFYKGAGKGKATYPASWVEVEGETRVRTLYGPIPMSVALDWPVMTTYSNLSVYAEVKGGRLPTEAELRLFFDKFEAGYEGGSNVGFRNWHPVPATTGGKKEGGRGGNGGVWEWTSTVTGSYDGFVSSELYPGYASL